MDKRQFWNDGYRRGIDYRQIADGDVIKILSKISPKPKTALDLGCGTGELCRQLHKQKLQVTGVDISDTAIKLASSSYEKLGYKKGCLKKN